MLWLQSQGVSLQQLPARQAPQNVGEGSFSAAQQSKTSGGADAAAALYDKQMRNFGVYGGYYTAANVWVAGEPAKPDGAAGGAPAGDGPPAGAAPAAAAAAPAAADPAAATADAPAAAATEEEKADA